MPIKPMASHRTPSRTNIPADFEGATPQDLETLQAAREIEAGRAAGDQATAERASKFGMLDRIGAFFRGAKEGVPQALQVADIAAGPLAIAPTPIAPAAAAYLGVRGAMDLPEAVQSGSTMRGAWDVATMVPGLRGLRTVAGFGKGAKALAPELRLPKQISDTWRYEAANASNAADDIAGLGGRTQTTSHVGYPSHVDTTPPGLDRYMPNTSPDGPVSVPGAEQIIEGLRRAGRAPAPAMQAESAVAAQAPSEVAGFSDLPELSPAEAERIAANIRRIMGR